MRLEVEALRVRDALLDHGLEAADETLHGPGRRVAQSADRVALDLARHFVQHADFPHVRVAHLHAFEERLEPPRALAARRALAAGLVAVEVREASNRGDHVHGLVHDRHGRRAQPAPARLQVVKVHQRLLALVDR